MLSETFQLIGGTVYLLMFWTWETLMWKKVETSCVKAEESLIRNNSNFAYRKASFSNIVSKNNSLINPVYSSSPF